MSETSSVKIERDPSPNKKITDNLITTISWIIVLSIVVLAINPELRTRSVNRNSTPSSSGA